jgi:hypothetical protein
VSFAILKGTFIRLILPQIGPAANEGELVELDLTCHRAMLFGGIN